MSRAQEILGSLLGTVSARELPTEEHRATFEKIKGRLLAAVDLQGELLALYRVRGFADFALTLMWVAQQAEQNPLMVSASPEDTMHAVSFFRQAVGERSYAAQASAGEEAWKSTGEGEGEVVDVSSFAVTLEQLVEAVQGGDERRSELIERVLQECDAATASSSPDEYKRFCLLLAEFLKYVWKNQLLDDIRVLNILSNIPPPIGQWAITPPEARKGLLEEEIGVLRDFKSHFE
jgi:hypothetical protein